MKKTKEYQVPQKRKTWFKIFKAFLKVVKPKPEIINLNENMDPRAIFVSNHSAGTGPVVIELYFPQFFIPWGTYQMCGNYKSRWNYLYHIYCQEKKHWGKFVSFLYSTLAAVLTKPFYAGMQLIPTYPDVRMMGTIKKSVKILDDNKSVLLFPEDSSNGYLEVLTQYFTGFVTLAKVYYRKRGIDLPIYPVYFHKNAKKMVIGKPMFAQQMIDSGMSDEEVAKAFKDAANNLFSEHIEPFMKKKKAKKAKN